MQKRRLEERIANVQTLMMYMIISCAFLKERERLLLIMRAQSQ